MSEYMLGEYCQRLGLTGANINRKLPMLIPTDLTNGLVYEVFQFQNSGRMNQPKIAWSILKEVMYSISGIPCNDIADGRFRKAIG